MSLRYEPGSEYSLDVSQEADPAVLPLVTSHPHRIKTVRREDLLVQLANGAGRILDVPSG